MSLVYVYVFITLKIQSVFFLKDTELVDMHSLACNYIFQQTDTSS